MYEPKTMNGYRLIYNPSHPKALNESCGYKGYVYEHILVAEEKLKRELHKNEVVHHLDGNRSNNRIENLLVLDRGQHTKLHKWLDCVAITKVIDENGKNSEKPKYCLTCGRTLQEKQKKFCSVKCNPNIKKYGLKKLSFFNDLNSGIICCGTRKNSFEKIGKKYGVSRTSIIRWFRQYKVTPIRAEDASSEGVETSGADKNA